MAPERRASRVVITGIGSVSGYGWGIQALRQGLRSGRTAITEPRIFDTGGQRTHLAAEAPEVPESCTEGISAWKTLSQADRFAVVAAREAVDMADLDATGPDVGVYFGGSTAGMVECEE